MMSNFAKIIHFCCKKMAESVTYAQSYSIILTGFQAGCGACIVTAHIQDPTSGEWIAKSVNSVRSNSV